MNSAARTIQRAWRRTAVRIGRLGESHNKNAINYTIMKGVPLKTLHQILLQIARNRGEGWKYNVNARNGHMYQTNSRGNEDRMSRHNVVYNIARLTNIRPNMYRNRAARLIQAAVRRRQAAARAHTRARAPLENVLAAALHPRRIGYLKRTYGNISNKY